MRRSLNIIKNRNGVIKMFDKKKKDSPEREEKENLNPDLEAADEQSSEDTAEAEQLETEAAAEFDNIDAEFIDEDEPDPAAEELARQKESYLRLAAEYENFRKRTVREKEALSSDIKSDCVAELLPVIDNLERALAAENGTAEAMRKGVELVLSQSEAIFEKLGVSTFGAPGDKFDPNLHHCVSTVSTGEFESGQITLVMQKGYMLSGKIIRPAMVQTEE